MRAIINRKIYDIDTATAVASWSNGQATSDFSYLCETIYRTPRGNWFLYGEGGAASKYARQHNGYSSEGEEIVPLDESKALDHLEAWNKIEAIQKYFPDEIEEA